MTTFREAAQSVLERWDAPCSDLPSTAQRMESLRTALEAPEQKPVTWTLTSTLIERETTTNGCLWFKDPVNALWSPLYAAPVEAPDIKALTKERDECREFADKSAMYIQSLKAERDALVAAGKIALEALDDWYYGANQDRPKAAVYAALQALKQAQTVEPEAWLYRDEDGDLCAQEERPSHPDFYRPVFFHLAPPPAEPHVKQPLSTERAAWINTPEKVREFFGSNFDALHYGRDDQAPDEDDKYTMSAHDIISAFAWSADMLEADVSLINEGNNAQQVAVPANKRELLSDGLIDAVTLAQWGEMKGYPLAAHRAYARAIEAKAQQVAVPAWISVIERMPERVDVLVYSPDLRNPCGQLVGRFMNGGWHCAGYEMVNTTHWMPIPQPPQGDET